MALTIDQVLVRNDMIRCKAAYDTFLFYCTIPNQPAVCTVMQTTIRSTPYRKKEMLNRRIIITWRENSKLQSLISY